GSRAAYNLDGAEKSKALRVFGTGHLANFNERIEWHHVIAGVSDVILPDVFRTRAIFRLGFNVHAPLPAKAVEVIYERAAHECLKCLVNIDGRNTLFESLGHINVNVILRDGWTPHGGDAGEFRPLIDIRQNFLEVAGDHVN